MAQNALKSGEAEDMHLPDWVSEKLSEIMAKNPDQPVETNIQFNKDGKLGFSANGVDLFGGKHD